MRCCARSEHPHLRIRNEELTCIHIFSQTLAGHWHNLCDDTVTPLCRWFPRLCRPCSFAWPAKGFGLCSMVRRQDRQEYHAGLIDVGKCLSRRPRCEGWDILPACYMKEPRAPSRFGMFLCRRSMVALADHKAQARLGLQLLATRFQDYGGSAG